MLLHNWGADQSWSQATPLFSDVDEIAIQSIEGGWLQAIWKTNAGDMKFSQVQSENGRSNGPR